jgi:hypothetical protein
MMQPVECNLFDEARKECHDRALATAAEKRWDEHLAWEAASDVVHTAEWRVIAEGASLQEAADFLMRSLWDVRTPAPKRVLARLERKLRRSGGRR